LVQDLSQRGIRTRRQTLNNGQTRGGIRFGVGTLAHLLRNRFYIGEVVYRGAVHSGEQEPIVDRALFEAVQARLAVSAANRQVRIRSAPAILAGRIFDDRGNRMTPTHANKKGVRYRYYVSHALLQNRSDEAGGVPRVPAYEIETTVISAIRDHLPQSGNGERQMAEDDRDLIEQQVQRITIKPQEIEIRFLRTESDDPAGERLDANAPSLDGRASTVLTVPWTGVTGTAVKGILHSPSPSPTMSPERREELLCAIAKARSWIKDLEQGHADSFAEIAEREGKAERHIRFLAPLAFVSPPVILAIAESSLRADLNVTKLVKLIDCSWAEQQRCVRESA
jgi:site-specific DNA recombinase